MNLRLPLSLRIGLMGVLLGPFALSTGDDPLSEGLARIQAKNLLPHVAFLASEECGGRDTPSPGLERAASYLVEQYKAAGLEPGGDEGSFLRAWDYSDPGTSATSFLKLESSEGSTSFVAGRDFEVIEGSPHADATGEPLFLGYGIDAGKYRYSDYVKSDARGKILIALSHEPREKEKGNSFEGIEATRYSSVYQKAKDAAKAGAAALLVVTDPKNHKETGPAYFNNRKRTRLGSEPSTEKPEIPILAISLQTGESILGKKLLPVQEAIDRSLSTHSIACPGKKISLKAVLEEKRERPKNVVAVRKGNDPTLSKEVVVVGAHYDHVGTDERGQIWPGADDNASGTALLLELAKSFALVPTPRTLLFVHFSGEEINLLGSEAFVRSPTFPVSDMVAMINADMVGRGKRDTVAIQGLKSCPSMEPFLTKAQRLKSIPLKIDSDPSEKFFLRSDQVNFFKAGVPVLFFMGVLNEHEDYHHASDTAEKIDGVKLQNTTRLLFLLTYQLATDKAKPERPKENKTR